MCNVTEKAKIVIDRLGIREEEEDFLFRKVKAKHVITFQYRVDIERGDEEGRRKWFYLLLLFVPGNAD